MAADDHAAGADVAPETWDARAAEHESRQQLELAWQMLQRGSQARQQLQQRDAAARAAAMAARLDSERTRAERARLQAEADHAQQQAELLQQARDVLEQVGLIGQELTEQLDLDAVLERMHAHLSALVDAPQPSVWLLDEGSRSLQQRFGGEAGIAAGLRVVSLDTTESPLVQCCKTMAEVEHAGEGTHPDLDPGHRPGTRTRLFGPLRVRDKVLGVVTMQSPRADAFGERDRLLFRAVCTYGAIALDNAAVCASLEGARRRLQDSSDAERQAREQAEGAARMKSEFLVDIAKALRTPLRDLHRSLIGMAQAPLSDGSGLLHTALRQSHGVNQLASELLDLARLESGGVQPTFEVFSLPDLLQDVLLKEQPAAARGGRQLRISMAPQLPDVVADIAMVERALSAFITFALRRTPAGGHVLLHLEVRPADNRLCVRITDRGPALAQQARRVLFNRPTGQGPGSDDGGADGAGLSLAIARQMLLLNGSEAEILSPGGVGAEVVFTLALATP